MARPRDIRMNGLVRFSLLTPDYYSDHFDSMEATAAHIFAPDRLARRFRLFEAICLPSLVRQSDPEFGVAILTSDRLPAEYLERLLALVEPHPFLSLAVEAPDNQYRLLKRTYRQMRSGGPARGHVIQFRLDDDDAVDIDFVARTKRIAAGLLSFQDPAQPTMICHNHGFYLEMRTDGPNEFFDSCERAPLSVGSALLAPMSKAGNPYTFNHRKFAQHYTLYSDLSTPGFLRTLHPDNKSRPAQLGLTRQMAADEVTAGLERHFGVDVAALRAL